MFIVKLSDQPIYTIVAILEYQRRETRGNIKLYAQECYRIKKVTKGKSPIIKIYKPRKKLKSNQATSEA